MNRLYQRDTPSQRVAAVIVTYNRLNDLKTSVDALLHQTTPPDHIIVINNNSTDETAEFLLNSKLTYGESFHYINLQLNVGGAGGFKKGMEIALGLDIDRLWLLDDDGIADQHALQELKLASNDNTKTYASTAVSHSNKNKLCWPPSRNKRYHSDLQNIEESNFAPFLGFFIHRSLVNIIGLPNQHYFISGDDYEYSLRLKKIDEKIHWVKNSIICHPEPNRLEISFLNYQFRHLKLDPWRHYYNTRNRLWTAKSHATKTTLALTLTSITVHLLISLVIEPNKIDNYKAYISGVSDGLNSPTKNK